MKNICTYIAIIALLGCSKTGRNDFSDSLYIRGRAFFTDTFSNNIAGIPFRKAKIFLSADPVDTNNYMYNTTTDSDGYFVFNLLEARKKNVDRYRVYYSDSANSILYSGETFVSGDDNNIALNIDVDTKKQTVLLLSITDSIGGAIPDATVLLFSSKVLADIGDASGAIVSLRSDKRGYVSKFNLSRGTYYATASKNLTSITLKRPAKAINIGSTYGSFTDSLQLK